jgi:hypothetical protein
LQDFEDAEGLPPLGATVPLAYAEASHQSNGDDRVDWNDIQSEGSESSQAKNEVPPLGDREAGNSSCAPADKVVLLDDENDDDDGAPFMVKRRSSDAAGKASKAAKTPGGTSTRQAPLHQAPAVQTRLAFAGPKRAATAENTPEPLTLSVPAARARKK